MALRFLDSFDHYTTGAQKWTVFSGTLSIVAGALRSGIAGLRLNNGNCSITLDAQGTWIIGIAYRPVSIGNARNLMSTVDAGSAQCTLRLNTDGTLSLYRGDAATLLATSTRALQGGVYVFIELKHVIADAVGTLELRVNEEVWATYSGDTKQTANATANAVQLRNTVALNDDWDDLYILDGTGAAPNNDYWGDTHVETLLPNAAGTYTELATLVGAASNREAVDEAAPDDDTSYVADSVADRRDSYNLAALGVAAATINGIQTLLRARKTDAGAASIARLVRTAATDYQGSDVALSESYAYVIEQIALNPNSGVAWTVADVNALEAGARVR